MEQKIMMSNGLSEKEQQAVNGILQKLESWQKDAELEYVQSHPEHGSTEEEKHKASSTIMKDVLKKIDGQGDVVKRMNLATLWKIYDKKLYDGFGHKSLSEFIKAHKVEFNDGDYMLRLARGVEVILEYVHQRNLTGNPIMAYIGDGEKAPVTVEWFIAKPGFVTKLGMFHYQFSQLEDAKKQDEFIGLLATNSRSEVFQYIKDQHEGDDVSEKIGKIHGSIKRDKDKIDLTLRLTEEQLEYLKRTVKNLELDSV